MVRRKAGSPNSVPKCGSVSKFPKFGLIYMARYTGSNYITKRKATRPLSDAFSLRPFQGTPFRFAGALWHRSPLGKGWGAGFLQCDEGQCLGYLNLLIRAGKSRKEKIGRETTQKEVDSYKRDRHVLQYLIRNHTQLVIGRATEPMEGTGGPLWVWGRSDHDA